jgi:hypothetical protein
MLYNVPRMGDAAGFVHADNGTLECQLVDLVNHYVATVTKERLEADMKAANFDHYQNVGERIVFPDSPNTTISHAGEAPPSQVSSARVGL